MEAIPDKGSRESLLGLAIRESCSAKKGQEKRKRAGRVVASGSEPSSKPEKPTGEGPGKGWYRKLIASTGCSALVLGSKQNLTHMGAQVDDKGTKGKS